MNTDCCLCIAFALFVAFAWLGAPVDDGNEQQRNSATVVAAVVDALFDVHQNDELPLFRCYTALDAMSSAAYNECTHAACRSSAVFAAVVDAYRDVYVRANTSRLQCVDFDAACKCTLPLTTEMCVHGTLAYAGDSLVRRTAAEACATTAIENLSRGAREGYFFPSEDMWRARHVLAEAQPAVLFAGLAFHYLSLYANGTRLPAHTAHAFEDDVNATLAMATRARVRTVWFLANSVCTQRYDGAYAAAAEAAASGANLSAVAAAVGETRAHVASTQLDRFGALSLNRRALRVIRRHYPHTLVVDGFAATDYACERSDEGDGRHFAHAPALKARWALYLLR